MLTIWLQAFTDLPEWFEQWGRFYMGFYACYLGAFAVEMLFRRVSLDLVLSEARVSLLTISFALQANPSSCWGLSSVSG